LRPEWFQPQRQFVENPVGDARISKRLNQLLDGSIEVFVAERKALVNRAQIPAEIEIRSAERSDDERKGMTMEGLFIDTIERPRKEGIANHAVNEQCDAAGNGPSICGQLAVNHLAPSDWLGVGSRQCEPASPV
jgi:hypothetical protein